METKKAFNIEDFDIKLNTDYVGRNFIYCEEIDSTNSFLMKDEEFQEHGTVLLTEFQTKGRGRLDRTWTSAKEQNLLFSILLNKNVSLKKINLYNLTTALSIGMALENLFQLKPEMKWPNDVLVNRKKIAGILCDSVVQGKTVKKLIIGIGINVNQVSFAGKYRMPPTSIRNEVKRLISRERLLSEFLNIFEENLERLKTEPEKLLDEWRDRSKLIGEKIWIIEGNRELFGLFKDVDKQGRLILQVGDKTEVISSGDLVIKK